jgi:hypothetical protein
VTDAPSEACPRCGSAERIPIAYGMLSADTFEAARRGELALGDCVVETDRNGRVIHSAWRRQCGHDYGRIGLQ